MTTTASTTSNANVAGGVATANTEQPDGYISRNYINPKGIATFMIVAGDRREDLNTQMIYVGRRNSHGQFVRPPFRVRGHFTPNAAVASRDLNAVLLINSFEAQDRDGVRWKISGRFCLGYKFISDAQKAFRGVYNTHDCTGILEVTELSRRDYRL
jgi:hypothetical protein